MAVDADTLRLEMVFAIREHRYERTVTEDVSPMRGSTYEAKFMSKFTLRQPHWCLLEGCRVPWAIANVLHFFSGQEGGGAALRRVNPHADRFLTGDRWVGAYGVIAMPQLRAALAQLKSHPTTRRAHVTMSRGDGYQDINQPSCWTALHLLVQDGALHLGVDQRSLSLDVFPYDCSLFANILMYCAAKLEVMPGTIEWVIASLHCRADGLNVQSVKSNCLQLPFELLNDSAACFDALHRPSAYIDRYPELGALRDGLQQAGS